MPKKKRKYPKLPNGYGQIRYLGKNRRNPYGVYPPATETYPNGEMKSQKAICYVDNWLKGFAVLTSYKAGTYTPGDERDLVIDETRDNMPQIIQKLLCDYSIASGIKKDLQKQEKTFSDIYHEFYKYKFENEQGKKLSESTRNSTRAAFKNCSVLHDRPFRVLRHDDLQSVVDNCTLKHASLELIVSLFHQMYAYADIYELCDKDYSAHVKITKDDDDINGVPFSNRDIEILWAHRDDEIVEFILIMIYSGFRIAAYQTIEINVKEQYFRGGVKTKSSKDRVVPIHSAILPLVQKRLKLSGELLTIPVQKFRKRMYRKLEELNIDRHTPHDCRHTFSMLCEKYGVNDNDRKRLLGHSFGADITNSKYGHRTIDDLRKEIEKIQINLL